MAPAPALSALGWRRKRILFPLFGLLGAGIVAARILERGELWSDRTYWLVALAAVAGPIAAALTRLVFHLFRWRWVMRGRHLITALIFAGLFLGIMASLAVAYNLVILGTVEPNPLRPWWAWFWIIGEGGALFLIFAPSFFLPWPLPLLMLLAGALLPPLMPKAVEPEASSV